MTASEGISLECRLLNAAIETENRLNICYNNVHVHVHVQTQTLSINFFFSDFPFCDFSHSFSIFAETKRRDANGL